MTRKEEIIVGRYLRTLSDSISVPVGTIAKVDSVGTTSQGEFAFTVRWQNVNTGTQVRPISDRSLNLWEARPRTLRGREQRGSRTRQGCSYSAAHPKLTLWVVIADLARERPQMLASSIYSR